MKAKDARKTVRRAIRYSAWIDLNDGSPPRGCTIADVSVSGAKLHIQSGAEIPERFRLLLTRDGQSIRQCQVVRRENLDIAVKFIRRAPAGNVIPGQSHKGDSPDPTPLAEPSPEKHTP